MKKQKKNPKGNKKKKTREERIIHSYQQTSEQSLRTDRPNTIPHSKKFQARQKLLSL